MATNPHDPARQERLAELLAARGVDPSIVPDDSIELEWNHEAGRIVGRFMIWLTLDEIEALLGTKLIR